MEPAKTTPGKIMQIGAGLMLLALCLPVCAGLIGLVVLAVSAAVKNP